MDPAEITPTDTTTEGCTSAMIWNNSSRSTIWIMNPIDISWLSQDASLPGDHRHLEITWWRHQMETFPRYWPFVRGIHWSPVNSRHKGQRRGALMFSLICAWRNGLVNHPGAGDLRRYCAHHDVIVMNGYSRAFIERMPLWVFYQPEIRVWIRNYIS